MNNIEKAYNEQTLIEDFTLEQLERMLELQIKHENYEGAQVVLNAINQYDEVAEGGFTKEISFE